MKQTQTIPETFLSVDYTRDRAGLPLEAVRVPVPHMCGHSRHRPTFLRSRTTICAGPTASPGGRRPTPPAGKIVELGRARAPPLDVILSVLRESRPQLIAGAPGTGPVWPAVIRPVSCRCTAASVSSAQTATNLVSSHIRPIERHSEEEVQRSRR
jgi:hypothetical protein